ncbi:MAG: ATP-grasp domain-containing protein [Methylococcaceae bacterium]|nr:ATP-grasp domain-containing protein [Methylococcaceae bacterium]
MEIGLKTVVIDRNPDALGMGVANLSFAIDILDARRAIEVARANFVDGVLTMQSDLGVPTVGAIVDALSLPGNGAAVAKNCSNKILTRKTFAKKGIPQPVFEVVSSVKEAKCAAKKTGYPCVLKAPDSSGSKGVFKVNCESEIKSAFDEALLYTKGSDLILEEFISGVEFGAQCFSMNGKCLIVMVHDDMMSSPPYMIPVGHSFPSSLNSNVLSSAEAAIKEAVESLGINTGPSNVDCIVDTSGKVKIIEIGARMGATCLPELLQYHTGINWTKQAVMAAIGKSIEWQSPKKQPCAALILQSPEDGVFFGYHFDEEIERHPGILGWEVTARRGQKVSKLRKGSDRIGKVVTTGKTPKEAVELALRFCDLLHFDIRHSR